MVQRQVAHGITLVAKGAQHNPLFRFVSALHNAVIIREVGLRVKILVQDECPVGHRHLLDAVEREGEEAAILQPSEQVPAAAEEFDAIGGYSPGGIGRRAVAAIGDVDEYAALHRFYYLS